MLFKAVLQINTNDLCVTIKLNLKHEWISVFLFCRVKIRSIYLNWAGKKVSLRMNSSILLHVCQCVLQVLFFKTNTRVEKLSVLHVWHTGADKRNTSARNVRTVFAWDENCWNVWCWSNDVQQSHESQRLMSHCVSHYLHRLHLPLNDLEISVGGGVWWWSLNEPVVGFISS